MILADKIIEERKKNGWSQEELADKLGVSRQAVSKWESAGSIPDLQRIIQLSELFEVSTDYLLREEITPEYTVPYIDTEVGTSKPIRRVSMEEANDFLDIKRKAAPLVANAVTMCITAPAPMIILAGLAESRKFKITETMSVAIGITFLLLMVAAAVFIFITCGGRASKMEYLEKESFETAYGVTGMVKERKSSYEAVFTRGIAIGVVLCILAVVPLIGIGIMFEEEEYIMVFFVALLLVLVGIGVNLIIRVSTVMDSYNALLQEGDFTESEKRVKEKLKVLPGAYWCIATAIYLGVSFWTGRWDISWIIWPVAGVLFPAVLGAAKLIVKDKG
ncbi:MAG TPA: helix-turn-helix transcriptional regulator [Mogibacterium sp.]|nr:helix-turn-helix transcriptional regulator [Mogibacterium sp.]